MGHKKLIRFKAIATFPNVLQYPENIKGNWSTFFANSNPIVLELACGKGEYSVGLGRESRSTNYIGVDIKGNRIYNGAKKALDEQLSNVAFLRIQIGQISQYFEKDEVSEMWIVFPDPFLKKGREKNRLTHPRFLNLYQQFLRPSGKIHLKTDSRVLYDFTLETIAMLNCPIHENIPDIYAHGMPQGSLAIRTYYEGMHLADNRTISYVCFSLPDTVISIPERFRLQNLATEEEED
jgi:tRNA (guanine-N7-)-methyltransferase